MTQNISLSNIFVADSYEAMSENAANDIMDCMMSAKQPLICTASGDSPAGTYKHLVQKVQSNFSDISNWSYVGLDEWVGLNGNDEGSCRYYLDQQLFGPLDIPSEKICFFDGRASDLEKECSNTENFIARHGAIQVAVVGLGMNGHIGMNEPGTSPALRSHVITLDPMTQQVGQKYFKTAQPLTQGITLGLATLLESTHILLLVSGEHKSSIVRRMLVENISDQLPCTQLRNHPRLKIHLDKSAAKLLF